MKPQRIFLDFILKEWLLFTSIAGVVITSVYLERLPSFSVNDIQIVFILGVLFIAVKGLENSGLILKLSKNIETGKLIPLKLIAATLFLSMIVTNDVALIVIVPLTLALNITRKDILIIFEALAANAGSALTPIGNPQNLFIYWFYNIPAESFISEIAPFTVAFIIILLTASVFIKTSSNSVQKTKVTVIKDKAYIYCGLLLVVILTVLHILPVLAGVVIILYAIIFDKKSLKIDYALLFTFLSFMGLAENMKIILASGLENSRHIFIFSALLSQIISNVPAALLISKFTTQWEALLWGTNVGGFGSLVGSLANLIAYKLYVSYDNGNNKTGSFTIKFILIGYAAFFIGIVLYFLLEKFY